MPKRCGCTSELSRKHRNGIIRGLRIEANRQIEQQQNLNERDQRNQDEVVEMNHRNGVQVELIHEEEGAINDAGELNRGIVRQFLQPAALQQQEHRAPHHQRNELIELGNVVERQRDEEEHASNHDSEDGNESDGADNGSESDEAEEGDESDAANAGSEDSDDEPDNVGNRGDDDRNDNENDIDIQELLDENEDDGNAGNNDNDFLELFGDRPLYTGATVTVRESVAMLLTFMLNHNVNGSTLVDLFSLIQMHCPADGFVKLSLYKLKKYFEFSAGPVNKKYYCSVCCQGLETPQENCTTCPVRKPPSHFVQIPLIPQITELFARPGFYNSAQHRFTRRNVIEGSIEDMYDAQLYKEQVHEGFLSNPQNFSMTYFTDGVPVFKSKNYSFWGFYLTINELPYKLRIKKENTLLAGLWIGPHKPHANLFMTSFLDDFQLVYNGFHVYAEDIHQDIHVRGILLAGVADTPARSLFLNTSGHKGHYGCFACECRGESVGLPNGNDTFAFRFENPIRKRTVASMMEQAGHALNLRDSHIGIKGPTALRLFMPDFVRGTGIDLMHLIQGVAKKLIKLHFSSTHRGEGFSLRELVAIADEMLLNLKPPKFIHRMPRSIEDWCHWKASEFKAWFFYYSVVIYKEIMRPVYFDHYLKLVIAVSYLSASSISLEMIAVAEELLQEFVRDFEDLYGLRFCSINIHVLLHLADCVRELGPTWVYTCFPYESINGEILRIIHGKTNVDSQVTRMHWQWLTLPKKLINLREGRVKDFCLSHNRSLKICDRVMESCYAVGTYSNRDIRNELIIGGLQNSNIPYRRFKTYHRLLKNSLVYVSEKYNRDLKSSSSFVAYRKRNSVAYGTIYIFLKVLQCGCNVVCDCPGEHFAIIRGAEQVGDFHLLNRYDTNLHYLYQYRMTLEVSAIPLSDLITVCFFLNIRNKIYIARPVNAMEVE